MLRRKPRQKNQWKLARTRARLFKKLPAPLRTLIGDLSDVERVLVGLDLRPRPPGDGASAGS